MKVLYFAWLRTRVGVGREEVTPPPQVTTAAALMDWLAGRSDGHAAAFANRALVRIAINQDHVDADAPVGPGDEVAFFPPVTGG